MSKFMFVFRGGAPVQEGLSPNEIQEHMQKWQVWVGSIVESGNHLGGDSLQNSGRTIQGKSKAVTDGPYAELKDLVTGNLVIKAESLDAATEVTMGCPIFDFNGSVEIRPLGEM